MNEEEKEKEIEELVEWVCRIKNAIKEVKSCNGKWIRENLKKNLNPFFTKLKDGSEELDFGIDSCYKLQYQFQNTEKYNKKDIIEKLKEDLEEYTFQLYELLP